MGKRSDGFERIARDFYTTPLPAVVPLRPFLPEQFNYIEPCSGDGRLVEHISTVFPKSFCTLACDIEPQMPYKGLPIAMEQRDAFDVGPDDLVKNGRRVDYIITNPPWSRDKKSGFLLHRLIEHFSSLVPTWLLFDADWMHNVSARPLIDKYLVATVSVGRVQWMEGTGMSGKDNCAWYQFTRNAQFIRGDAPRFYGRRLSSEIEDRPVAAVATAVAA